MLKKFAVLMLLAVCLSGVIWGCGVKGPPRPPDEPAQKK